MGKKQTSQNKIVNIQAKIDGSIEITEITENIETLVGHHRKNFLSNAGLFKSIFHENDYDLYDAIVGMHADPRPTTFRIRFIHKSGQVIITKTICYKKHDQQAGCFTLNMSIEDSSSFSKSISTQPDHRFFGAMMEKTDDYIFFKSRDHLFTAASQTLIALTSENHWQELIGKTDYQVFPKEYADIYYSLEKKIFSGQVEVANEIQRTLDNDGNEGWVDNRKYPIKDEHGEIIGLFGVARDITEIVNAKNEIKRLNEDLQKQVELQLNDLRKKDQYIFEQTRLAQMGEMAAGVGHEINNPLTICIGNVSLVRANLESGDINVAELLERLERVEQGHERIRKIVDGLRIYARSDSALTQADSTIFVQSIVEKTVSFISEIYVKEGVKIITDLDSTSLFVRGSVGKLEQVILNLVSNARDATEGQSSRVINLLLKQVGSSKLIFSVKDNGTGIPNNIRDKILDPFFTTKKTGKGTGMGLGFVNEIIKSMKGELEIESVPGQGSTFSITIPLTTGKNFHVSKTTESKNKDPYFLSGKALVVDNEEGIRELLTSILESMGLEVDVADDGDTAIEMVKLVYYDYICTDMKMPRMRGERFIEEVRKLPNGDSKIFIITGGVTTEYADEGSVVVRNSVDGYILKPFTKKIVFDVLSKKGLCLPSRTLLQQPQTSFKKMNLESLRT